VEPWGKHADNVEVPPLNAERAPERCLPAPKEVLRGRPAQDRFALPPGRELARKKRSPKCRLHSQHLEELLGDIHTLHHLRMRGARDLHRNRTGL
jgi:hypothetical protein